MTVFHPLDRSTASIAFEDWWRKLAGRDCLPSIERLDPLDIPDLVPGLVVARITLRPEPAMKVTLSGSNTQDRTGINLTGQDARSFYDETDYQLLWESSLAMIETPCGLLQLNDVVYKDAQNAVTELTLFPMTGESDDIFFLTGILEWVGYHNDPTSEYPMRIKPSDQYAWIDLGHGLPDL